MLSFDNILESNIKTGVFQFKTISIIGLIEFCDGVEYTFMSIMMTILKSEWNLTQAEVASLGSSFLMGVVGGNFICAYITDAIGRKTSFTIFVGFSVLLVYYTSLVQNFHEILLIRFLFGLVFGSTSPLGYVFISEVVESKVRGRFTFSLTILYVLGKIYLVGLCFIFLNDYKSGNWRGLIKFNTIPVFICFLGSIFYIKETVRYSMAKGKYSEAFQQIDDIALINQKQDSLKLTPKEKDGLIQWQIYQNKLNKQQNLNKDGLFSPDYKLITLKLWGLLILANYQNMSIYLLMPFLFAHNNSGFEAMLFLFIVELLFSFLIYHFIDNPKYGGRVKIIMISSIILLCVNFSLYVWGESILYVGLLAIKIATRGLFSTSLILTSESYPLKLRSKGSGLAQGIGKLVAIPSPYIIFPLFYIDPYLPFGMLCILALLMILIAYSYPQDRTLKHLEVSSQPVSST